MIVPGAGELGVLFVSTHERSLHLFREVAAQCSLERIDAKASTLSRAFVFPTGGRIRIVVDNHPCRWLELRPTWTSPRITPEAIDYFDALGVPAYPTTALLQGVGSKPVDSPARSAASSAAEVR